MRTKRVGMARIGGALVALTLFGAASCGQKGEVEEATSTKQSAVSTEPPEMAAASIPRFQTQLPRFFTYAPTLTRNAQGQVTRKEFTVRMAKFNDQQLPPGFPSTQLFGYGGDVFVRFDANGQAVPALEQTRAGAVPAHLAGAEVRADAQRPRPDPLPKRAGGRPSPWRSIPTLDWANPNNFPKPTPPFLTFPPGYPQAQNADLAHDAHARHRGGPRVRRHARHLVHDQRHPRSGIRVERLHATQQQPGGAVLVSRPRVRRHPPGRRLRAVGLRDLRDPAGEPLDRVRAMKTSWASRIPTTGSRPWRRSSRASAPTACRAGTRCRSRRRTSSSCAAGSSI